MKKIMILVIAILITETGFLSGCTTNDANPPRFAMMYSTISKTDGGPGVEIKVTVKNIGGTGSQTISVKAAQGNKTQIQPQTISLDDNASQTTGPGPN